MTTTAAWTIRPPQAESHTAELPNGVRLHVFQAGDTFHWFASKASKVDFSLVRVPEGDLAIEIKGTAPSLEAARERAETAAPHVAHTFSALRGAP